MRLIKIYMNVVYPSNHSGENEAEVRGKIHLAEELANRVGNEN